MKRMDKMIPPFIGVSRNIEKVKKIINQVANSGENILISGETGVGKDLLVQNLYQSSNRFNKPFIKVNCAAIPESLLESEMFGFEKNALTGVVRKKAAIFEKIDGGILFLDKIGELSFSLQSKLLNALQEGDITFINPKIRKNDTWVIAANNYDLKDAVERGRFDQTLYFSLSTLNITIEPLRNRPEDIPHLIDFFYNSYKSLYKGRHQPTLSEKAIEKLSAYHWPGNVRELQNVIKRFVLLDGVESDIDKIISRCDMHGNLVDHKAPGNGFSNLVDFSNFDQKELPDPSYMTLKAVRKKVVDKVEAEYIASVLDETSWNRSKATEILSISYKTLLSRIKELNLHPPQ